MSKLKNSIITQILNHLECGDFCLEDFEVQFPNDSSRLAQLTFKALPKYTFILDESHSGGVIGSLIAGVGHDDVKKIIRTMEKPGEYKNSDIQVHNDIGSAISRVSVWVSSIRDDLVNSRVSVRLTIDGLTKNFQESIDENIEEQESHFKLNEVDDLKSRLDELQERIAELETRLNISPEDINKIQKVIDKGKLDLKLYPKGVWYKTVGTKIIKTMNEVLKSKEGREVLADMAKKLLQ